jgi:hypothetical protein
MSTAARIFSLLQTARKGSEAHTAFYTISTGLLSRAERGRGVKFTALMHVAPRIKMRGAIPLHPLYAFTAWTYFINASEEHTTAINQRIQF